MYGLGFKFLSGECCFSVFYKLCARYLPQQVVSSAIGNEPPPGAVITVLETSSMASTSMGVRALPCLWLGGCFCSLSVGRQCVRHDHGGQLRCLIHDILFCASINWGISHAVVSCRAMVMSL